jgi:uncharacterized protein
VNDEELLRLYREMQTIAVVGASSKPTRPGHTIPRYLQVHGYRIIPVTVRDDEVLGERAFRSLTEIDQRVDVVDVFRPPAEAEAIAREAIAIGARVLWFQPGTDSEDGARLATEAGLSVVTGRCMGVTHRELGLGPGP